MIDVFELSEPKEGVSHGYLWGPSLVRPSAHTYVSPWVLLRELLNDSEIDPLVRSDGLTFLGDRDDR